MEEIGPMSGGRSSREKGIRAERRIVDELREVGLDAYRIPLSGSVAGFKCDVELRLPGRKLHLESKARKGRFGWFYKWLKDADALVIKKDCNQPLIVMRLTDFASLLSHMPSSIETITHKPPQSQAPDSLPIKHSPQPIYRP